MLSKAELEKRLLRATAKHFLPEWEKLRAKIVEQPADYNSWEPQIKRMISEFNLVPAPQIIWNFLLEGRIPFMISPAYASKIAPKKEWLQRLESVKMQLTLAEPDKNARAVLETQWAAKGTFTSLAVNTKTFAHVQQYTIADSTYYWLDGLLAWRKFDEFKDCDLLLWAPAKDQDRYLPQADACLKIWDLVDFASVDFPEIEVFYSVKQVEVGEYILDGVCPHRGACLMGQCPNDGCVARDIHVHPYMKPTVAFIKSCQGEQAVPVCEERAAEIFEASVKRELLPGQPTASGKEWEEARKRVLGKERIRWIFAWKYLNTCCARVLLKNRKNTPGLGNIFSLPPVISYDQAADLQHKAVRYYPISQKLQVVTVKRGYQKAKAWNKIDHDEPPAYLIPMTNECSVEETLSTWPIIQTLQAISCGRQKKSTYFMQHLCGLIEECCLDQDGKVTLDSIKANADDLSDKAYAVLQFTTTNIKRPQIESESSRTLLSMYCKKIQRVVKKQLEADTRIVSSYLFTVDKACSQHDCEFPQCPFRHGGCEAQVTLFDMTPEELWRIYQRSKRKRGHMPNARDCNGGDHDKPCRKDLT